MSNARHLIAAATVLLCSATAQAAPLLASEVLTQFNAVVLGNVKSYSQHVDGRSYVGGSVDGGDYAQHPNDMAASNYAGLTVRGSATNVKVNSNGAVVGGSINNSIVNTGSAVVLGDATGNNFNGVASVAGVKSGNNFNGGQVATLTNTMSTNLAAASSTDFGLLLGGFSDTLKLLSSTGSTVTYNGNKATFNAVAGANGLAVFDLTAIDDVLFTKGEFEFNLNGATGVLLNTDVTSASISANFLGGFANNYGSKLLWNFFDATSLTINNQWGGSVLATEAAFTNNQNIEGGVYVKSLEQRAEIHLNQFTGTLPVYGVPNTPTDLPEPGSIALLFAGMGVMGLIRQRRRAAAA